jgi:hypothetical protein
MQRGLETSVGVFLKRRGLNSWYSSNGAFKLQVFGRVLRLVCPCKCGLFHKPEPKQSDPPEPWPHKAQHGASTEKEVRQDAPQFGKRLCVLRARVTWKPIPVLYVSLLYCCVFVGLVCVLYLLLNGLRVKIYILWLRARSVKCYGILPVSSVKWSRKGTVCGWKCKWNAFRHYIRKCNNSEQN